MNWEMMMLSSQDYQQRIRQAERNYRLRSAMPVRPSLTDRAVNALGQGLVNAGTWMKSQVRYAPLQSDTPGWHAR